MRSGIKPFERTKEDNIEDGHKMSDYQGQGGYLPTSGIDCLDKR